MKIIETEFDATLHYGFAKVTGLEGLIIESGGGSGRNPDHTKTFRDVLTKFKDIDAQNATIYIAAKSTLSNNFGNNEARKIEFENKKNFNFSGIDLNKFMSNANDEIREKGKAIPQSPNGSIHKRLLIM